ncbi:ABC transporter ATP-binding protein [Clostridium sp. CM028]|uniref:ABC transporter ATP-binding protein n=1 Tax=unclassified Clostridium TaxID=2614128 RepID=UPI001C6E267B|nr:MULTISPECIES: ABC transporter ATP-binding protein [unclassified Clostridium]MBW9147185.1 ABC transporter ATP-binding protein [Clostridium sp. CM027]MBW9150210.1 ABC transporter ATP-binding protein [Clostridium sp. CM028]UVE39647.1 ABC transporter ATP-binding protein [Clostridium sp. CM027]WLC60349.1 ABC transporter ATP-binding protein [Clostridium sp. CM028]
MSNILEARSMNKKVELWKDNELHILKDVNFAIEKGEFVTVMGPSGSGKSTLLYNVSGMDRITSGSVKFKGSEMVGLKEEELAKIRLNNMGFIFQDINLLKNLSVIDNVMFPAFVSKDADKNMVNQKAKKLLKMTGIEKLADNNIIQASGGQLQRAGICRALINDPDIIFGDEPTGALDSNSAAEIMSILAGINKKGTTIMLVTHDVKVAAKTERILYMVDGNIVAQKKMRKYDTQHDDIKEREESIMKWLVENGF